MNILHEILNNPLLSTAGIMTVGGTLFYSLKSVPKDIFSFTKKKITNRFIYTVRIYDFDELFDIFERWLYKYHSNQYRDVQAHINSSNREGRKIPNVFFKQAPTLFTLKYKGKTIFIVKDSEKLEHAQSSVGLYAYKYVVRGFNCREEINALIQEAVAEHYSSINKNYIRIRTHDSYGNWGVNGSLLRVKAIDKIVLSEPLKSKLVEDLNAFKNGKEWYFNTHTPYKRGYCFYGPPGTGKTSLSLAIASYAERDVYILNINSLKDDGTLQHLFSSMGSNSLLLVEDIDSVFNGRSSENKGVSFSCLLNCLDGAFYKEGLIICITTNHLDKLDSALLRKGRIDVKECINYPGVVEINEFLNIFYEQSIKLNCDCENLTLPMSAIQEICISNRNAPDSTIQEIEKQLIHFSEQKNLQYEYKNEN